MRLNYLFMHLYSAIAYMIGADAAPLSLPEFCHEFLPVFSGKHLLSNFFNRALNLLNWYRADDGFTMEKNVTSYSK